jgi:hypothetical protein
MTAPPITFYDAKALRIGNTPLGILIGTVTVAAYDTAHPALAALTGKFRSTAGLTVSGGVTSAGWAISWDVATSSFKAYGSNGAAPAALVEAPNGTNIGNFTFHAIGRI